MDCNFMIKFLHKKISNFIQNKRGYAAVVVAGSTITLVTGILGSVVLNDFSKKTSALQALADQAVLSAQSVAIQNTNTFDNTDAITNENNLKVAKCEEFFNKGIQENPELKDSVAVNSVKCTFTTVTNLRLDANVTLKPIVVGGLGATTIDIIAFAAIGDRAIEIVYALGMQGTMCSKPVLTTTGGDDGNVAFERDLTCKKFTTATAAITESINRLSKMNGGILNRINFGVVPYNYKVKFPNVNRIPPSLTQFETEVDFFKDLSDAEPLGEIIPMNKDFASAKSKITTIKETMKPTATAWGRADIGMHVAALMLDPTQKAYFNNYAVRNWSPDGQTVQKVVVLIADAINIGCCYTNNPDGNYNNQYVYNYLPYNTHMLEVCDALKSKGVKIATLLINTNSSDAIGDKAENLMARCAGTSDKTTKEQNPNALLKCGSDKQECFVINTADDINEALDTITDQLMKTNLIYAL